MEVSEEKGGRGEVRKIQIIYFLCQIGRQVEHPHLIRVHHLNKNGVYLRDVKRWLADLRGKDMPESFTWSYKRRYKNGYVWRDLSDDDIITPISDNEFVLKGSEFVPIDNTRFASSSYIELKDEYNQQTEHYLVTTKSLSEMYRESPVFGSEKSTLTDDSSMLDDNDDGEEEITYLIDNSLGVNLLNKKRMENGDGEIKESVKKTENDYVEIKVTEEMTKNIVGEIEVTKNMGRRRRTTTTCMPSLMTSSRSSNSKNKSSSSGALKMFRNLMSCGGVETNDAVLVRLNPSNNGSTEEHSNNGNGIRIEEKPSGSGRVLRTNWNHNRPPNASLDWTTSSDENKPQGENCNMKVVSAAYKPVREPTCSQCGKCFKPEKMHSHMKSCKGMKVMWKNEKTTCNREETTNSSKEELTSLYLLTN